MGFGGEWYRLVLLFFALSGETSRPRYHSLENRSDKLRGLGQSPSGHCLLFGFTLRGAPEILHKPCTNPFVFLSNIFIVETHSSCCVFTWFEPAGLAFWNESPSGIAGGRWLYWKYRIIAAVGWLLLSVHSLSHASRASSLGEGAFWCENAPYRLPFRPPH